MKNYHSFFDTNKRLWNEKTHHHVLSDFYDNESFLQGRNSLNSIELEGIGEIAGKSILHLQCHFGQDSLSMARMGAKVTGVDLSDKSIALARNLNEKLGLDCQFVDCNVYDLRNHIDEQFDLVFTSYGAICWLPELNPWFDVIDQSLKTGGEFYIAEFHPALYMFEFPTKKLQYHYFNVTHYTDTQSGSYAAKNSEIQLREYFWNHSLSEVFQPFLHADYKLARFKEHDYSPYDCFEHLVERSPSEYIYDIGISIPHVYEIKMIKGL